MNQDEYAEAKKVLEEISTTLADEHLTSERDKLKSLQTQLSGQLLSIWIPFGWGRRVIMAILLLLGLYGSATGKFYLVFSWIPMALFSPHVIGELAYLTGRISRR